MYTKEAALPYRYHFIGVGLDTSEVGHPSEKFACLFVRWRDQGSTWWPMRVSKARLSISGARFTC